VLLLLAAASVALVVTGRYGGLWLTALGAVGMLASSYVNLTLLQNAPLSWGWAVLGLGAAALLLSAILRERFTVAPTGATAVDEDADVERWDVLAASVSGETRNALRGILWEMDRDRTESDVQKLLNADEIPVASGLPAAAANQLLTRLYEAGVAARKRRTPTT
jgi:hypothetical protein